MTVNSKHCLIQRKNNSPYLKTQYVYFLMYSMYTQKQHSIPASNNIWTIINYYLLQTVIFKFSTTHIESKYSMQPHNSPKFCKIVYHHEKGWHKWGYYKPRQPEGWGKTGYVLTKKPFAPSWVIKLFPEPIWCRNQYLSSISQPHHFSELVFQVSNCSHYSLILCQ